MQKSDWKKCKLGEICTDISYGYTASAKNSPVGPKFLRITDIIPYFIDWDSVPYCEIETNLVPKYKLELGDIVIARTGATSGFNSLIDKDLNCVFASFLIRFRLNKEIAFPKFIKYVLKSEFYQEFISNNLGGSAQPGINAKPLSLFPINLPPVEEQKRIAQILGALDDKIELLQKQNKTLEDMAKAIFKSWFVDFDVVHAKANLAKRRRSPTETLGDDTLLTKADIMREYHLTDELYDLFPSDFENSSLGPIPLGWQVKILGDFFPIKTGKKDANVASKIGQYPFFSCAQNILWTDEYSFDDTALLLAGNGDFNLKWYRGKFEAYQRTYVLIPNNAKDLPFLYYAMQFFLDKITLGSRGSVIKFITKGMIENYKLVIPEEHLWEYMSKLLGQWTDKIESNLKQIQTLTELRDTLLPPLISGKIRV